MGYWRVEYNGLLACGISYYQTTRIVTSNSSYKALQPVQGSGLLNYFLPTFSSTTAANATIKCYCYYYSYCYDHTTITSTSLIATVAAIISTSNCVIKFSYNVNSF